TAPERLGSSTAPLLATTSPRVDRPPNARNTPRSASGSTNAAANHHHVASRPGETLATDDVGRVSERATRCRAASHAEARMMLCCGDDTALTCVPGCACDWCSSKQSEMASPGSLGSVLAGS